MYRHILVAVGPGFSEAAMSTAIARARDNDARLTILHVAETTRWWAGWQGDSLCDMPSLVTQLALVIRRHCERMTQREGVDAQWLVRTLPEAGRSIGRVIADEANRLDADLIVLGAEKRGLLGIGMHHVRNVVCRHTEREVLIARECIAPKARVTGLRGALLQAHHA
ncbi:Universal stress protein family protein [Caballeronia cordobensis]|uniref:Universal stress protein family protein n=1 Tax=Caballeronia cordobensis TaxID=1353886 RepID=A0A158G4G0_CABCO|nr:universal stress protein [Caballeronia cordobensis]SAL26519.1 Universal stress protein family protein [Caballeronia cordobensis]